MPYNDSKGPKMESAKQERKDLLRDNPVVRDMDSSRPWMSKHFQSTMGSAMRMDHEGSPATAAKPDFPDIDGDGNTSESMKQAAKDKKAGGPEMKMDGMSMKYGDGPKMNHDNSPASKYGSAVEKHCMGPRMSALHENHVETGQKQEDEKPQQPQRMGRIVKKMAKKPANFDQLSAEEKERMMKEMGEKAKQ